VNEAPRATDTLANERTFLAYVRTALAFIGFGFVVARFALFEREVSLVAHISIGGTGASTAFGTIMAIAGIATGAYGSLRYALTDRALRRDRISAMPAWVAVVGGVVIAVVGLIVAINLYRTQ
jgi:putative membrane protein